MCPIFDIGGKSEVPDLLVVSRHGGRGKTVRRHGSPSITDPAEWWIYTG